MADLANPLILNGVYFFGVNLRGAVVYMGPEGKGAVHVSKLSCPTVIDWGWDNHEEFRADINTTVQNCVLLTGDSERRRCQNGLLRKVVEYCEENGLRWLATPIKLQQLPNSEISSLPTVSAAKSTFIRFNESVEDSIMTVENIDDLDTVLTNTVGTIAKRQTQCISNISRKIDTTDAIKLMKSESQKINRTLDFEKLPPSFRIKLQEFVESRFMELMKPYTDEEADSKGDY